MGGTTCLTRSEPEAAALLGVARAFKPHVWMNAHSGMEALFMPYDHLPHIPEGEPAQATLQVGAWEPPKDMQGSKHVSGDSEVKQRPQKCYARGLWQCH